MKQWYVLYILPCSYANSFYIIIFVTFAIGSKLYFEKLFDKSLWYLFKTPWCKPKTYSNNMCRTCYHVQHILFNWALDWLLQWPNFFFQFGYLVAALEWLTFVCTHSLGAEWKASFVKPPIHVTKVMANSKAGYIMWSLSNDCFIWGDFL